MRKRLLLYIILSAMLIITACSQSQVQLLDFTITDPGEHTDLEGREIYFRTEWESNYHIPKDYKSVPPRYLELKNDRFIQAEKDFNTTINFGDYDPIMRVSAGYGSPEILDNALDTLYDYYKSGLLVPIENVRTIDLNSGTWGAANFIKYGNFNGKQYGIYPINWLTPETTGAMMYNGTLVKALGGTVPYEYRENGTWTWETFENEIRKYPLTYADAELTALITQEWEVLAFAALHSNDIRIIEGNNQSGYKFTLNSSEAHSTLEWLNSLYNDNLLGVSSNMETFTFNNECVYYIGESYFGAASNPESGSKYAPLVMENFGFITFPHGPNGTEKNVGSYTYGSRRLLMISDKGNIEVEIIGEILNYIFAPLEGYTEEVWRYEMQNMVLQSEESFNNWLEMMENPEYNFSTQLNSCQSIINQALAAAITGTKTPVVAMAEIEPPANEAAAKISFVED